MEGATFAKLTSMHFYAWKSGLKTGMYYLRTKSAVDAKKFTLSAEKKEQPVSQVKEQTNAIERIAEKRKQIAINAIETDTEAISPEEYKKMLAQAKASQGDDDCLMCGS